MTAGRAHRRNLFSVPSKNPFEGEKKTRRQVEYERRTSEYVADHPGSYVVRAHLATGFASDTSRMARVIGMLMYQPRAVHFVADRHGLAAMQSRKEAEWEKPWSEVISIDVVGNSPTRLQLDAVGWHAPKQFVICKPDGEPAAPAEASVVARRLRELSVLRHRADDTPTSE